LRDQFDHNMRVRDLVSDLNKTVAEVRACQRSANAVPPRLNEIAAKLITSPIRYSQPGLQTHITYLYSMTTATDQKIGHDAVERYDTLKKEFDQRNQELK